MLCGAHGVDPQDNLQQASSPAVLTTDLWMVLYNFIKYTDTESRNKSDPLHVPVSREESHSSFLTASLPSVIFLI